MCGPAAKSTAKIRARTVARIGEEEDPAVPAALEAGPQVRLGSEQRPKDEVVLQDEPADLALVMPLPAELEAAPDFYG